MPLVIVVGVQWGDEGKGKVVDYLTEKANLVVRFQGGNNAGHTVVVGGKKTALRLIPSGILRDSTRCLLASGVVVDPHSLLAEFEALKASGLEVTPKRLGIAAEVQLILPYHQAVDVERERNKGAGKIGTTGKGIGPAYEDSVSRAGIRMADLLDPQSLKSQVETAVAVKNSYLKNVLQSEIQFDSTEVYTKLLEAAELLKPYITDVGQEVATAIEKDSYVVFEGAQGSLLDISHGTYPYVTSSNTVAGYACASAGFGPKNVDLVIGICKAYCTRVGSGPFPSEDSGPAGEALRKIGAEFGTVTGRPRRCGWFDSVAVRRAIRLNGIDALVITKLDVLSEFETIKIGTGYKLDGKVIDTFPLAPRDLDRVEVSYLELPGWREPIGDVRSLEQLPENAKRLLREIEKIVDCEVGGFSVGPDRVQTIILSEEIRRFTYLSDK